jgi:tetratricopeptide (TPR) repeat protein
LERAAQLTPEDANVLWSLGYVYGMLGKYQDAVECFQRAIQCEPRNVELHEELGHWLGRLGRKDEAVAPTHTPSVSIQGGIKLTQPWRFIAYSVLLSWNGKLDQSQPTEQG